jgi:hypothetical protein
MGKEILNIKLFDDTGRMLVLVVDADGQTSRVCRAFEPINGLPTGPRIRVASEEFEDWLSYGGTRDILAQPWDHITEPGKTYD